MITDKGFQIRQAKPEDIPFIYEVTKEAFEKYVEMAGIQGKVAALTETEDDILYDIQHKYVFVAFLDSIPVGSLRVEIRKDHTAYLSRFGVRKAFQNSGIGKALMNVVDRTLRDEGIQTLSLHTASTVTSLVRFYYARGFYIDSTSKDRGYVRALLIKDYTTHQNQQNRWEV